MPLDRTTEKFFATIEVVKKLMVLAFLGLGILLLAYNGWALIMAKLSLSWPTTDGIIHH